MFFWNHPTSEPQTRFRLSLVATRSEIATLVLSAAVELGIRTIAIYSQEDPFAPHQIDPRVQA